MPATIQSPITTSRFALPHPWHYAFVRFCRRRGIDPTDSLEVRDAAVEFQQFMLSKSAAGIQAEVDDADPGVDTSDLTEVVAEFRDALARRLTGHERFVEIVYVGEVVPVGVCGDGWEAHYVGSRPAGERRAAKYEIIR